MSRELEGGESGITEDRMNGDLLLSLFPLPPLLRLFDMGMIRYDTIGISLGWNGFEWTGMRT